MKKRIISSLLLLSSVACYAIHDVNPLRILEIDLIPVSCNIITPAAEDPISTATVTFEVTGGTPISFINENDPVYAYSIDGDDPQSDPTFTNISAGEHNFSITDADNEVVTAVIFVGPAAFSRVRVSQAPYCNDRFDLGVISVDTDGGTPPINQDLEGANQTKQGSSVQFDPVGAGRYTVVSTPSDGSPCQPTQITLDLIIPQASGNELLDFINEKYCIPCED